MGPGPVAGCASAPAGCPEFVTVGIDANCELPVVNKGPMIAAVVAVAPPAVVAVAPPAVVAVAPPPVVVAAPPAVVLKMGPLPVDPKLAADVGPWTLGTVAGGPVFVAVTTAADGKLAVATVVVTKVALGAVVVMAAGVPVLAPLLPDLVPPLALGLA